MTDSEETQVEQEHAETALLDDSSIESSPAEGSLSEPKGADENKGRSNPTEKFVAFSQELDTIPEAENKLRRTIEFMETALSQENGVPHFKNFWDARDICLKLFKENLNHQVREVFWGRYSELSREARRLKDILDEQSAFAMEQIEIAIKALEEEISSLSTQASSQQAISLGITCQTLEKRLNFYGTVQAELNLLNAYAARINSMRKELIKTDMRVRHKNKFFQRLSTAGDHVFPRRKELIGTISDAFVKDVDDFIQATFDNDQPREASYILRDEIKAIQALAKALTLNTHAFTTTRGKLSVAWDKVKEITKERKKARMDQQAELRQNADEIKAKIDACSKLFAEGGLTVDQAFKEFDVISNEMRDVRLGRDEVRYLRDALRDARQPMNNQVNEQAERRLEAQREIERQRRQKYDAFKDGVQQLIEQSEKLDLDMIIQKRDELRQEIQNSDLQKGEKRDLDMLFKPMVDIIQDKKEQALMNLSEDDLKSLQQLREVLSQRMKRRQEIKDQLEVYRKEMGASGLDFVKAMTFNEQISIEKERLEKINQGIEEIEDKIEEMENKVY